MKRILLLTTLAAMLAASMALSGVVQAAPIGDAADAKCAKLARQTLGASYTPANYTFIGGTEGNDELTGQATDGPDVICGFGGDDAIRGTLDEGDIFIGGEGNDAAYYNYGTFYGGAGYDYVSANLYIGDGYYGTFYGGAGYDYVSYNTGIYYGGVDEDFVEYNGDPGIFYGEEGDDEVLGDNTGEFYGGAGDDYIAGYNYSIFYGGDGFDEVFAGNWPVEGP
jgi:hypothetical protein